MGQKSSIDRLPPNVREALNGWLRDPAITQEEATERSNLLLEELGAEQRLSKSAVNRYSQKMEVVGARLRESREVAEMWIAKLGTAPQGKIGNLVNEILRTFAFDVGLAVQNGEVTQENAPAAAKLLKNMAIAMERLERAASENVKREEEIRLAEREQAKHKLDALERDGKAKLDPATLERVRREIYGIV